MVMVMGQPGDALPCPVRQVSPGASLRQGAPQPCLPVILLVPLPGRDELGPVDHILVEQVPDSPRQLNPSYAAGVSLEVGPQGREGRRGQQIRQQRRDTPGEALPGEGVAHLGRFAENLAQHQLHEVTREQEPGVGPDTEAIGEPLGDPSLHAPTLHHQELGPAGRGHGMGHHLGEAVGERFQVVAAM